MDVPTLRRVAVFSLSTAGRAHDTTETSSMAGHSICYDDDDDEQQGVRELHVDGPMDHGWVVCCRGKIIHIGDSDIGDIAPSWPKGLHSLEI